MWILASQFSINLNIDAANVNCIDTNLTQRLKNIFFLENETCHQTNANFAQCQGQVIRAWVKSNPNIDIYDPSNPGFILSVDQ